MFKRIIKKLWFKECSNFAGALDWSLTFDNIYLKNNENKIIEIKKGGLRTKIIGTYPYIKGNDEYYNYIK